jgi:hypothetical protein
MDGRSRGIAAATTPHRVHHDSGFGDAEARAAQLDRHGNAEPAAVGHRPVEFLREAGLPVAFAPVIVAKAGADLRDTGFDGALVGESWISMVCIMGAAPDRRQSPGLTC